MTVRILPVLACFALLAFVQPADALFIKPDLEKIPVERLIKNLSDQLAKETKTTTSTRYNLARTYAMAYAIKAESVDINKKRSPGDGPWFGYTPPTVPFKPVKTDDKEKLERAQKYLEKAIETYRELVKDQPNFLPGHLGLAWCIEQSGNKAEAIKAYREVMDKAWDIDRKKKVGPLGGNFITKEAAGYLVPLLDSEKDADEISSIQQRVAILNKLPRPVTPIAVPLKDGLAACDLEDRNASVTFDVDGTALGRRWTWINKNAAWLVHAGGRKPMQNAECRMQNESTPPLLSPFPSGGEGPWVRGSRYVGLLPLSFRNLQSGICSLQSSTRNDFDSVKIESGLQLFGNVTFWCFWDNGYQALRSLDDDGDGALAGDELRDIALWHDANANGLCEPGEVRPLSAYGIVSLSCAWQTDPSHPDRIAFSPRGVTFANGATRPTFDLVLHQR